MDLDRKSKDKILIEFNAICYMNSSHFFYFEINWSNFLKESKLDL